MGGRNARALLQGQRRKRPPCFTTRRSRPQVRLRRKGMTTISRASTAEEVREYWDAHDVAEVWDETHAVDLELDDAASLTEPTSHNGADGVGVGDGALPLLQGG